MKRTPEEEKRAHVAYLNVCRQEVEWYQRYGKWPDRIHLSSHGVRFVIGDWSWNRSHPTRREIIEPSLPKPT